MEELIREIKQTEHWLREHPHADPVARHDKIVRLRELNQQLNQLKNNENESSNSK